MAAYLLVTKHAPNRTGARRKPGHVRYVHVLHRADCRTLNNGRRPTSGRPLDSLDAADGISPQRSCKVCDPHERST